MHKPEEKDDSGGKSKFRLHYFPDIPVDIQSKKVKKKSEEIKFKRIKFSGEDNKDELSFEGDLSEKESRYLKEIIKDVEVKAYIEGFNKGEKEGIESGKRNINNVLNKMESVIERLGDLKDKIFKQNENEIIKLSLAIAKKIIDHEVITNKAVVKKVIRNALEMTDNSEIIKIKMNPDDYKYIMDHKDEIEKMTDTNTNIIIEEDEKIEPGGCFVETGSGDIDARIEEQCKIIEESFDNEIDKMKSEL